MAKSADVQIADELTVFEGLRPTRTGDLVVESQGIAPIPEDHRYGGVYRMFTVWFTPNMELSGVFTGTLAVVFGLGKTIVLPGAVQWLSSIAWDALVGLFGGQAAQLLFHVPFWVGVAIVLSLEGIASVWATRSCTGYRRSARAS